MAGVQQLIGGSIEATREATMEADHGKPLYCSIPIAFVSGTRSQNPHRDWSVDMVIWSHMGW